MAPRSLLLPLALLALLESRMVLATTTITMQPNDTHPAFILAHCDSDCDINYNVVEVSWESTVSTITAYGDANSVAWTKSMYSQYFAQFSPELVVETTVATDWRNEDFTATCCDDGWYIQSGVTAHYETETLDECEPTEAVFTGRRVGTVRSAFPTDLPFLEHDCEVSTTVTKTILTQITFITAGANPPTGTADGQKTWWDEGSDEVTILLPPTPTPFFTISKCPFVGASSCSWSVGTMNLRWDQSTITITGDASELSSLESELATSIEGNLDWVNATAGWADNFAESATCCSESIWLDRIVTINYGGWCPTTVLTGYNTILPLSIAYRFVNGTEANCNINIGGGIASTKTAIYIEKVTADTGPGSTTTPPATKEPDTVPTSTTSDVTKETDVIDSTSQTTPTTTSRTTLTTTSRTTPRTTPHTTAPQRSTTTSSRQAQLVESPQSQSSRPAQSPNSPPVSSQGPRETTTPNNQPVDSPTQAPNDPPNTQPNNQPSNPSQEPPVPSNNPPPNESPNTPAFPGTPAPEPSISTIFTSIPVVITTTDGSGSQTIITTFTTTPISTAINVITTDDEGNTVTTRVTFSNPSSTEVPDDGSTTEGPPVPESRTPLSPGSGVTSRTIILTLTSRVGSSIIVETKTSIVVEPTSGSGTTSLTGEEPGTETETGTGTPEITGPASSALSSKSLSLRFAVAVAFLVSILRLF
ncbi:hypothetical protein TWF481_012323 [Arthrobotrys musiformis]|uniref:Uncharacterized protein n=1 Tax=Arthrobotrys musiformis TaxID=47236 RepID=A0AAV9VWU9_9PEZI